MIVVACKMCAAFFPSMSISFVKIGATTTLPTSSQFPGHFLSGQKLGACLSTRLPSRKEKEVPPSYKSPVGFLLLQSPRMQPAPSEVRITRNHQLTMNITGHLPQWSTANSFPYRDQVSL